MTTDLPSASIKHQSQTITPVVSDATLVDDPVALVDDATALVGGQSTSIEGIMTKATTIAPKVRIKVRR